MENVFVLPRLGLWFSESEEKEKAQAIQRSSVSRSALIRVLVVDDEPIIQSLFKRVLGLKGYEVTTAESGDKAIEAIKKQPFDIVFLDVRLPGEMNGVGTFEEIKKTKPDIPCVMITGFEVKEEINKALKGGAKAALPKPLDIKQIYDLINKFTKGGK